MLKSNPEVHREFVSAGGALFTIAAISDHFMAWADRHFSTVFGVSPEGYADLHKSLDPRDVNERRLALFKSINADFVNGAKLLWQNLGTVLVNALGPDVAIQRQFNISVHMPKDSSAVLDAHSDHWSGETPFQLNLWIPLTSVRSTNSMFVLGRTESNAMHRDIAEKGVIPTDLRSILSDEHFLDLARGQAVLFNSHLVHGNVENQTDRTRLSINIRVKGLWHPERNDGGLGIRSRGEFFRPLSISENSRFALAALGITAEEAIVGQPNEMAQSD
jgi:sporadic carbohydrate cluster 2OG-Fe(II) oxygenase